MGKESHYYTEKPKVIGRRSVISDVIRGIPVEFVIEPGVFSCERVDPGTKLLLEYAVIPSEGVVLDMGAGYGVIGITLAKINPKLKVYMVEINTRAVQLARINAKRNNVEKQVVVLQGNLYEPVDNMKFNAIYSNPPLTAGMSIVEEIIRGAKDHLVENGILQMVLRRGYERIRRIILETFNNIEVLASKRGYKVVLAKR